MFKNKQERNLPMKARLHVLLFVLAAGAATSAVAIAQDTPGHPGTTPPVTLVKMPYVGERNTAERSGGPDYLEQGGIAKLLQSRGCQTKPVATVVLAPDEQKAYGEWNRLSLANGDLAKIVAAERKAGAFPVGLLANCSALSGMLAGLQHSGPSARPLRVGLVFIDSHADFNTPETTLSGMLGGMPVAIASGRALTRMRQRSGLDPAVPERHIVEACVRDVDPLEQDLVDRSEMRQLSVADIREPTGNVRREMQRLSEETDVIYIHVDMDVLDPREVPGHPLAVPGGPTSLELAAALKEMFRFEKAVAIGVASTPYGDRDQAGLSRQAAYNLILGALDGVALRAPAH
jgi:arginase